MKIGIMGGTFDPIHLGHMIAAERAREDCGLDEVWFIPSFVPPHKEQPPGANADERLKMVGLAIGDHPQFRIRDMEIRRGGVSYSVDTVRQLRADHPDHQFFYIIGADMVQYLPKWYKIEEILSSVRFIGLHRPGVDLGALPLPPAIESGLLMAEMPPIGVSSTEIRQRRMRRLSIRYLVPERVRQYIEEKGLYEA